MATRRETVERIREAIPGSTARAMFGEYALYLDGKVVALVCDDTLYLKNLPGAAALLEGADLAPPYPGAKPHLVADAWLDDPETLAAAAQSVADALPAPKPRKRRAV